MLSASQALEFIAGAGEVLSSSLDYAQTLRRVARLAVPELADWCAVYLAGDARSEVEITSGHADPDLEATLLEIRGQRRDLEGASESRQTQSPRSPFSRATMCGTPPPRTSASGSAPWSSVWRPAPT